MPLEDLHQATLVFETGVLRAIDEGFGEIFCKTLKEASEKARQYIVFNVWEQEEEEEEAKNGADD